MSLSARQDFMTPVTVETKRFSSTRSSIVKMTARWEKGYIQMVWWINKHERSISNGVLCVIALPLSGNFKGHKIGMGFFGGLIFGPGIFWCFAGSLKDFFGSWLLAFGIRSSPSLEILSTPPGVLLLLWQPIVLQKIYSNMFTNGWAVFWYHVLKHQVIKSGYKDPSKSKLCLELFWAT